MLLQEGPALGRIRTASIVLRGLALAAATGTPFAARSVQSESILPQEELVFIGQALDEDMRPLVGVRLSHWMSIEGSGHTGWGPSLLETDQEGRFRVTWASRPPSPRGRQLQRLLDGLDASLSSRGLSAGEAEELRRSREETEERLRRKQASGTLLPGERRYLQLSSWTPEALSPPSQFPRVEVEVTSAGPSAPYDCGDLVLALLGSTKALERLSDDELEARYRTESEPEHHRRRGYLRGAECCLLEMVRRGGTRWELFLQRQLQAARTPPEDPIEARYFRPEDLVLLTALRRVQRLADPLGLTLDQAQPYDATFPRAPVILGRIVNQDTAADSFSLSPPGLRGGGGRMHVEVVDPGGTTLPPLPPKTIGGGGGSGPTSVGSKGQFRFSVDLGDHVQFPRPGEYRARILFHDQWNIQHDANLRGLILSKSPEFIVRVHPLLITMTRQEHADISGWIMSIDTSQRVPWVQRSWDPNLTFDGEPAAPEDRLFRAGWRALPVLLEMLQRRDLSPDRVGWILGMLWNVSGAIHPGAVTSNDVLGPHAWTQTWPSASERALFDPVGDFVISNDPKSSDARAKLVDRWLELRPLVELEIVD